MANYCCSSNSIAWLRILLLLIFLLLQTLHGWSAPLLHHHDHSGSLTRNLLRAARSQIPDCTQLVSESRCSQNPKCRWCRSESIDDTCFTRLQAWRLPQQVFSCD